MFLDFTQGHWLTVYRARLPDEGVPPLEMRIMTADRPEGVSLPGDVPTYAGHAGRAMWKLLTAWAGMGFRTPRDWPARVFDPNPASLHEQSAPAAVVLSPPDRGS